MTATAAQKVQELVQQAERQRLYGEIVLRFRAGRLTFIVKTDTTAIAPELQDRNTNERDARERR